MNDDGHETVKMDQLELAGLMHEAANTEFSDMDSGRAAKAQQVGLFMARNLHLVTFSPFITELELHYVPFYGKAFPTGSVTIQMKDETITLTTDEDGKIPSFMFRGKKWSRHNPQPQAKLPRRRTRKHRR
jgi:hypothetical protein